MSNKIKSFILTAAVLCAGSLSAQTPTFESGAFYIDDVAVLSGVSIIDGTDSALLSSGTGCDLKSGTTPVGSFIEAVSKGILFRGDTLDVAVRLDIMAGTNSAIVTFRSLNDKELRFSSSLKLEKKSKVRMDAGHIAVSGVNGVGLAFNPDSFNAPEKTSREVRLVSKPAKAVNARLVYSHPAGKGAGFFNLVSETAAPRSLPVQFVFIGASTCAYSKPSRNASRGWGMILPFWFEKSGFESFNHARAGTSFTTFVHGGCWEKAKKDIKPGTIVTIQFGINENYHKVNAAGVDRFMTDEAYADSLRSFAKYIRSVGATPVFVTPLASRNFSNGELIPDKLRNGKGAVMKVVGEELGVTIIDQSTMSAAWIKSLGEEKSKDMFCWYGPGIYKEGKFINGKQDNTHLNQYGAFKYTRLLSDEFIRVIPEIAPFFRDAKYYELEAAFGPIPIWSIQ